MSAEDLDNYETDAELSLYKEYRDVIKLFTYVVETERRFYLANKVDFNVRSAGQDVYFDVRLTDAWVWDVYRSSRFVKNVRIVTFKDVNVEEVQKNRHRHSRQHVADLRKTSLRRKPYGWFSFYQGDCCRTWR